MKSSTGHPLFAGAVAAVILMALAVWSPRETATLQNDGLTVPPGFEIERVAGPPLVDRPIVADFDEEGRLYVADSSGSNDRVATQLAERPHRIVRLEDKDGDGRYDTSVVFADKMMFPEGTMWFDGSLYVAAPPSIWKLTDTNGDGIADQREEWFQGKTLTNCANDLHGPYLGPDGWIYWTKGAFAEQTYERPGKPPFVTRASHIFRRRPGDSAIDVVMTGGMDNPVDVAFTPTGERIFTATFLEHPQLGRRDAIVHAIYGGVYGKPHAVIDGHKRTGDLMPVLTQFGPAVPAGLTHYASRAFGDGYRDNFFAALFNLHKVTRFVLEPSGATFKSHDSDFLVSDNRDFHPTDVIEDADGSLLVIDTGPWYKLCCPTSQLAKPELLGAIYRVRRQRAPKASDPRGLKLAWSSLRPADLSKLLDDARPAVRKRALYQFGRLGAEAVPSLNDVLKNAASADARRNAVWALTRIDAAPAREAVRRALIDRDAGVRHAALHSAGVWRDAAALPQLLDALKSKLPALQRAAAEAIGRVGDARAVPHLIGVAASEHDRILDHSLTYALIEIADRSSTLASGLGAVSPRSKRAALIALDQMEGAGLKPEEIVALLDSADAILKETAWWIAGHHPEWGAALVGYFQQRLKGQTGLSPGSDQDRSGGGSARDDLAQKMAQFGDQPAIQALLAETVAQPPSPQTRQIALRAMAAAPVVAKTRMKMLPAGWIAPLARALADDDPEVTRLAVSVVRAVPAASEAQPELQAALVRVARDTGRLPDVRLDALGAAGLAALDPDLFTMVRSGLEPERPGMVRAAAAGIIEKATLGREQLFALAPVLKTLGPLELPRVLPAFDRGSDEALGLALIAALEQAQSRSSVRADVLRPRLAKYPATVQTRGEALLATIHVDSARQAQRLEELLGTLGGGDVRRGQAVFNSPKAACLSCHAIGYLGGKVGPDLTRIGQVRGERDLLEAVVFPNASFVRSYEPIMIATTSGAVHTGVLRSEQRDEVVLAIGPEREIRIPRQEIKEMLPGNVSIMPAGYGDQLTRQELADLLAFLKATRSGA